MLRKIKWQLPGEPLAIRYNWYQAPASGRGPAVEKHSFRIRDGLWVSEPVWMLRQTNICHILRWHISVVFSIWNITGFPAKRCPTLDRLTSSTLNYCLIKKTQLVYTVWITSVHCQKHESLSLISFPLPAFVRCFVYNKPKFKFMHSSNHAEHILTYSMEQSPSWEANQWILQLVKNFPRLWNPKVPHRTHQCPPQPRRTQQKITVLSHTHTHTKHNCT
jgi:hypothetical protein